jgi:hypothetical protein
MSTDAIGDTDGETRPGAAAAGETPTTGAAGQTPTTAVGEAPTTELVSGAVGGRCSNCQAALASDQRYCLNCGQRRGKPRFPLTPVAATGAAGAGAAPRSPHRPRFSGAAVLVAGVATLLIALGVGFLIGHDSKGTTSQKAADQIITVGGSGSGAGTGSGASAASGANPAQATKPSAAAKASLKHAPKTVVVHLTPKVEKKVAAAAAKVFGQNGNLDKNVTQQVGGSCSGGAGCQNGKFTGNFFPGG